MAKRTQIDTTEMLRVMRHLADVAALKHDVTAQRQLLIDGLNQLVGTNQGFFFVADEWRPGTKPSWAHVTVSTDLDPVALRYLAEFGAKFPLTADPYCARTVGDASPVVTVTRDQVVPDRPGERTFADFLEVDRGARAKDGMVGFHRLGDAGTRIVGVAMHRFGPGERRLLAKDSALLRFAVAEVKALIDRGHLSLPPLDGAKRLPPRLKQVLDLLLSGVAVKLIARRLGLSVHTVREHTARLYRHFGVDGRDELMAKFIRPE